MGGTYVCMEGPQFSTVAESQFYRSWGMDVIGMTNLQEAKLAREAEICYTTIALVTDYDCWHPEHESVTVDMIVANLTQNAEMAQAAHRRGGGASAGRAWLLMRQRAGHGDHHQPRGHLRARRSANLAPIIGKYVGQRAWPSDAEREPDPRRRLGRLRHHQEPVRRGVSGGRRLGHLLLPGGLVLHRCEAGGRRGRGLRREGRRVFDGRPDRSRGLQTVPGETFRWKGEYGFDLNQRETIYTKLNVFEQFRPVIPEAYRSSPFVFLGNIHPRLQLEVLDQVTAPRLVAADTMNYWIEGTPDELREVLKRVDILIINDSEARELSREANLVKAARVLRSMGPCTVVIKRGENGVLMTCSGDGEFFAAPAMPLEEVFDPTGAGDTFAGGFVGYLAACGDTSDAAMARAIIYGSTLASFAVEDFSIDRLLRLTKDEIAGRFRHFKRLTHFDEV